MSVALVLVLIALLSAAAWPLRMAGEPDDVGALADSAAGEGDPDPGDVDNAGDPGPDDGAESAPPPAQGPQSVEDLAGEAIAAADGTQAPGAPPQPPEPMRFEDGMTPGDVLERLGVQFEGTPEQAAQVAEQLRGWYEQRYEPAARELYAGHQQQQQWWGELQKFFETPHYQWAAYLADRPDIAQQVVQFIEGGHGQPGAGGYAGGALPEIDRENLDDETRAIVDRADFAMQRADQIEQAYGQLQQRFDTLSQQWGQMQERFAAAEIQQRAEGLESTIGQAVQAAEKSYGFPLRQFQQQYGQALQYVANEAAGLKRRAELEGRAFDTREFDLQAALQRGLRAAGFDQIKEQRRRQARTSVKPPGDRAGGPIEAQSVEELAAEAVAAMAG